MSDISKLAEFTDRGLKIPTFAEIKDAVAAQMMEIYGYDIDLSSASADGQYIMMEALILNNIYQSLGNITKAMSPTDASDHYLDVLASFCGIFRQQPTYSTVQLYIWNTSGEPISPDKITCQDKNGNTWTWTNPGDLESGKLLSIPSYNGSTFEPSANLEFTCDSIGPVVALGDPNPFVDWQTTFEKSDYDRGGEIYETIDNLSLKVYQQDAAIPGKRIESDSSLRVRMRTKSGVQGITLLDALENALFAIDGVEDTYVYTNVENSDGVEQADDVTVALHDVYVAIWKDPLLRASDDSIFDQRIARTIYEQLTPGIMTTDATDAAAGESKNQKITVYSERSTTVYWKQATPANVDFQLTFTLLNVPYLSTDQKTAIAKSLITYLNGVPMNGSVTAEELYGIAMGADFRTKPYNQATYTCSDAKYKNSSAEIWDTDWPRKSQITKYSYNTDTDITWSDPNVINDVITQTLTISRGV